MKRQLLSVCRYSRKVRVAFFVGQNLEVTHRRKNHAHRILELLLAVLSDQLGVALQEFTYRYKLVSCALNDAVRPSSGRRGVFVHYRASMRRLHAANATLRERAIQESVYAANNRKLHYPLGVFADRKRSCEL